MQARRSSGHVSVEIPIPTQSGLFDIVQKARIPLSGFAAKNRGVLRSRARNEFEAAARKSKVLPTDAI
jgi:hypothetical protein